MRVTALQLLDTMPCNQPEHEGPTRERKSRMAQKKRPYGSGSLKKTGTGWELRWRETEIGRDGTLKKVLKYKSLGQVPKKEATRLLNERLALAGTDQVQRSRVAFEALAARWERDVLPMYRHSTQKNHSHILHKHLLPRFGDNAICEVTRQDIQAYVAELCRKNYAPKTIDHIHDVLSAIMRTAMKWGHLKENPCRDVDMPVLKTIRPKWVLTPEQAADLIDRLCPLARTMVGVALLTGLRRGELFALRWKSFDEDSCCITVSEAVYEGRFGLPKTEAGKRRIPLSEFGCNLLHEWKSMARETNPDGLVFCTRSGKPISPNNVLRTWVFPACEAVNLPHATWLTFRRTYCSWAHDKNVPAKVVAELMGHSNVSTTLNVYTQVLHDSVRVAADRIGEELFSIVQSGEGTSELIH